jgi:hypothetical protein
MMDELLAELKKQTEILAAIAMALDAALGAEDDREDQDGPVYLDDDAQD